MPGRVEERYLANVLGMFRASVEEHLPVTVIADWNLNPTDLARYKVLILPNTACLSDNQARVVADWVRQGGGLVATVDTSLCDEMGEPRKDFALADVFGVHYKGIPTGEGGKTDALDANFVKGLDASYWEKRKNIYDFQMGKHPDACRSPFEGVSRRWFRRVQRAGGGGGRCWSGYGRGRIVRGAGQSRERFPAIVARTYGKGRVAYMAAGFDAAYYLYSYPYQRLLMADAIRWAAQTPFGIHIDAPMCVHATYFRKQTKNTPGERLIVHLYNDLNSTGHHARPEDDIPLREETIPIHDIRVRFTGHKITRVHLEPEGRALPLRRIKTA